MIKIAPSILSADFSKLGEEVQDVEAKGADWIHVDVMDGMFVQNITLGPLVVEAIRPKTNLPLDVHLMIESPERYIPNFAKAGADYIVIHVEATKHLHGAIQTIKNHGVKAGVVLNPATPVCTLKHIIKDIDLVLLMSVNPGFGGQKFIPEVIDKIKEVKQMIQENNATALIEVDGGINEETARLCEAAGADVLVAGSAVYNAPCRKTAIDAIKGI